MSSTNESNPINEQPEVQHEPYTINQLIKPRPQQFITGKNNESLEIKNSGKNLLLYFSNCKNCTFTISNLIAKVIIEYCSECEFIIQGTVITGTMEIIGGNSHKIYIGGLLSTTTIDGNHNSTIYFAKPWIRQTAVYTAKCTGIVLHFLVPDVEVIEHLNFSVDQESRSFTIQNSNQYNDDNTEQYVTHLIKLHDDQDLELITERVIREGLGYATTQREKEIADARDEKNQLILQRLAENSMQNVPSPTTNTEIEPNETTSSNTTGPAIISGHNAENTKPEEKNNEKEQEKKNE